MKFNNPSKANDSSSLFYLSSPNIYSISKIFNIIVMKNFVLKIFHSFPHWIHWKTIQLHWPNLLLQWATSEYTQPWAIISRPKLQTRIFWKSFSLALDVITQVNVQLVGPFRGGGWGDVEPFVVNLMTGKIAFLTEALNWNYNNDINNKNEKCSFNLFKISQYRNSPSLALDK